MKAWVTGWGAGQSPPSDLSEAQTGPRSTLRLEVSRMQPLALGANDLVLVSAICSHRVARELFLRDQAPLWSHLEVSCQLLDVTMLSPAPSFPSFLFPFLLHFCSCL